MIGPWRRHAALGLLLIAVTTGVGLAWFTASRLSSPARDAADVGVTPRPPVSPSTPGLERAAHASASVLAINVTRWDWDVPTGRPGYAFVVRRTAEWSDLLTDYYLVADHYRSGDDRVLLSDGTRTMTGRVVAVAHDDHVARIRVAAPLPPLPVATRLPPFGQRVVVGAPAAEARATGIVLPYHHQAGVRHLAFSAIVAPRLDGAPVLDVRGNVVGIAEPSDPTTTGDGVGRAVPITAACAAVTC